MSNKDSTLTQDQLRKVLRYDPETGVFIWTERVYRKRNIGRVAGSFVGEGYRRIGINGTVFKAHRLAWLYVYGEWPTGSLDHIDGDKANNRIANLRLATDAMNAQNLVRANKNNRSSGILGVTRKNAGYQAQIQLSGKSKYLGMYATADQAHQAYLSAKRQLHAGCTI